MIEEHKSALTEVFLEVLQNMAFMFGEECEPEEEPEFDEPYVATQMTFAGPIKGDLQLAVPRAMCAELAANLLGLEPDDETAVEKAFDSLKELLNVTCGNVLTAIAGETPVFDLGMPEVTDLNAAQLNDLATSSDTLCLDVEQHKVFLRLSLN